MTSSSLQTSIAIQTLEKAAQAAYGTSPASLGLTAMHGADGEPLSIATQEGCTASAYLDANGNVIIAYEGTSSTAQQALDAAFLVGMPLAGLSGFREAVGFAQTVEAQAARAGIPASCVFVTGHSLGGTLAGYVAAETGLAGAAFAGSGLNGHVNGGSASNFVSFVNQGDPFANFATDAAESSIAVQVTPHMDHHGDVVLLGTQAQAKPLMSFITSVTTPGLVASPAAASAAAAQLAQGWTNHGLGAYDADIATQFGNETLAQIAALETPHMVSAAAIAGSHGTLPTLLAAAAASGVFRADIQPILSVLHIHSI